ncbi:MAG: hypothetical protein Q8L48_37080 [Archangium sp.]|nr:hypothetical protein [Archangium sp.]
MLPRALVFATLISCVPPSGPPLPFCGNGVTEGDEVCDGADVRGACGSVGLGPGQLRCKVTCDGFDTTACGAIDSGTLLVDAGVPVAGAPDAGTPDAGAPDAGPSMAITVRAGRLEHEDGRAVDVRGAISCCAGGPYGWPLFNETWMDLTAAKGVTFLHMRVGPFMTSTANGETDWAPIGGGYVESGGKADLTRFNEVFWQRVRALIAGARSRGQYVEVDVIDGWGIKHCRWGDLAGYSAWDSAFNAQAADHCATAGSAAVAPGSVADQWIRKVVRETGRFDNVLYQDGNEVGLIAGYTTAWTTSMHDVIRDEEQRQGYARHLFGTNSGLMATMQHASVDYGELHQDDSATPAQCANKPCLVNEYNPNPTLTPVEFHQRFCAARQQGTAFWYWRHGQSEADFRRSLDLMQAGCP